MIYLRCISSDIKREALFCLAYKFLNILFVFVQFLRFDLYSYIFAVYIVLHTSFTVNLLGFFAA